MTDTPESIDPAGVLDDGEIIEVVTREVDSEGNIIIDDAVIVVDADGEVVAATETITFETPEGVVMKSALGDDGEMHLVDDERSDDADDAEGSAS